MADTELTEGDSERGVASASVAVTVDGRTVEMGLPADADSDEAAVIATAVGAHLHDRARAAAAASAGEEEPDRADEWTLAARMKAVGKRRWPDEVERGEEWKAAARSFY
ncbi:hypothetical protein BRC95_03525 [Halobacteriales archaeon QS_5_68_33]|jgi:hypothetical protein|nr:MAG: hypothetical protein BRC95_03525 [Halobacteriales archaeon QS_5_68_33]